MIRNLFDPTITTVALHYVPGNGKTIFTTLTMPATTFFGQTFDD